MSVMRSGKWVFALCFVLAMGIGTVVWSQGFPSGHREALGSRFEGARQQLSIEPAAGLDVLHRWNAIAVNASGLDHTPVAPGENRVFGEQLGPGRASRAMAIVHIAIFDALNAIHPHYQSYTGIPAATPGASPDAAIARAAHDTLVALFPSQQDTFHELLDEDLNQIPNGAAKTEGIAIGQQAAAAILALRSSDGSQHPEPRIGIEFITSDEPGKWRQDPISGIPLALGAFWGQVKPFVMKSGRQFRVPPPPDLHSAVYAEAYNEAKMMGGDARTTPTIRSKEQTEIGIFWAYDGTPTLCAPPRLYNQITMQIADQMGTSGLELARLLALVHTAMADAAIAIWESKFFYEFWRPVTGIREADAGTGPTGKGDRNIGTQGDVNYSPLGAPASNLQGPNFTPPFPTYPSGHAGIGGALFQVMRRFYKTDNMPFTFVSDEMNGITKDNEGNIRPLSPRTFASFSQAEEENGQSRIYLGIHWQFDKTRGISQGRRVSDYVFNHVFQPLKKRAQ